jgi:hypothetical protein
MRLVLLVGLIATGCVAGSSPGSGDGNSPGGNESGLAKQPCYVGGCSAQLCGDSQNLVSTCEWREAYGCYKGAACERQANGQCGWTVSASLARCLSASGETCGGIAGRPCAAGSTCVDDPNDDCHPSTGADCGGVCVTGQ